MSENPLIGAIQIQNELMGEIEVLENQRKSLIAANANIREQSVKIIKELRPAVEDALEAFKFKVPRSKSDALPFLNAVRAGIARIEAELRSIEQYDWKAVHGGSPIDFADVFGTFAALEHTPLYQNNNNAMDDAQGFASLVEAVLRTAGKAVADLNSATQSQENGLRDHIAVVKADLEKTRAKIRAATQRA